MIENIVGILFPPYGQTFTFTKISLPLSLEDYRLQLAAIRTIQIHIEIARIVCFTQWTLIIVYMADVLSEAIRIDIFVPATASIKIQAISTN